MKAILLALALALPLHAANTLTPETPALAPDKTDSPANEALELFRQGRHHSAVAAARPLAEKGDPDALFLLAYASETGQGTEISRENALSFYLKAAEKDHKEATYRRALILLNSEDDKEREDGKKALEDAAKTDPSTAGRILGEAWLRGLITKEPDFEKGAEWWTTASEAGDSTSLLLLARLYSGDFGFREKADLEKSVALYRKAAGLGEASAYLPLGSRLLNGAEEQRNEKEGREWLAKAIKEEQFAAYLAIGDYEENVKKNGKAALDAYLKGAEAGQVECMLRSARFLYQGIAGAKDPEGGRKWLDKAAEAGSPTAHFEIARLITEDEKPDLMKLYSHLAAAADGGIALAQNDLGLFYLSGKLGFADAPAAAAWFTRAAKVGHAPAQNNLATLYERGLGVDVNLNNAGELYSLAANQGHGPATTALARLYANGAGTQPNLVKAWALATLAVERGDEDAKKILGELSPRLTPDLLEKAEKELEAMKTPKSEETAAPATEETDKKDKE
ncbi:tetratricopeptide repeat protein [Haloferula rosea]|uniref:Sel1 repeat family protein n=1 Tax=Haloferula rosea TaxID=490093 RepID=A0A934RHE7_9BACT|nr:tetratricopeptide repeat protein [Haloferula rosea]MBK1828576.1 sel1 repeat family protein [Haloferula rosea]